MKSRTHIFLYLVLVIVLAASCTTNPHSKDKCGVCPEIAEVLPNIRFRIVDKTTSQDLFWGAGAKYKLSDLKIKHIVNGKPDSLVIQVDSSFKTYSIYVFPLHQVDTVTMNVADKPQDILLFKTGTTGGCCPFLILNSVSFNGTIVYTHENGPDIVVFDK